MPEEFQVTEKQYQKLQGDIEALQQHKHTGLDSLQISPTDLIQYQRYGAYTRTVLTSAQVLALHTTPITLVAAPGANTVVIVDSIDAKVVFNTTAYTGANNLEFRYTNGSGTKVTADMSSTFINSASSAYDHVGGIIAELTPTANAAVVVAVPTANPGAGDSTIVFITRYRLLTY